MTKKKDFFQKNQAKVPYLAITTTLIVLVIGLVTTVFNFLTANKLEPIKNQLESINSRVYAIEGQHTDIGNVFRTQNQKDEDRFDAIDAKLNRLLGYFDLRP